MVQPIVFVGGILSFPTVYRSMRDTLAQITGRLVWVVGMRGYDWMLGIVPATWAGLLCKLDRTVCRVVRDSTAGKVTLVGHSAGGLLARLYLSPEPFLGHAYCGLEYVDHLVALGSPHHYQRESVLGGWLPAWIEERYPGAYFAPQVRYTSVAGKLVHGDRHGSLRQRCAYVSYRELIGDGNVWGDGLVPVESALLRGSHQIVLDGVSHFTGFGGPWYGTSEVVSRWWNLCAGDNGPRSVRPASVCV